MGINYHKKCLIVVGNQIFKPDLSTSNGGVQTYLRILVSFLSKSGWKTEIAQQSSVNKSEIIFNNIQIHFIKTLFNEAWIGYYIGLSFWDFSWKIFKKYKDKFDLIIYLDQNGGWPYLLHPSIYIQHGVFNDIPIPNNLQKIIRNKMNNFFIYQPELILASKVDMVICVDTNFINYYRQKYPWRKNEHIRYLPNSTSIPNEEAVKQKLTKINNDNITICFPRRFLPFRGLQLVLEMWIELSFKYPFVNLILCGNGLNWGEVNEFCKRYSRVMVLDANEKEIHEIFLKSDIVLIPSLGSEGTSLACIESMARGCVPIVSYVGGLGNLVIPDYNGLIIQPNKIALVNAIEYLISRPDERKRMASNSFEIAKLALSTEKWENRLQNFIDELKADNKSI